MTLPRSEAGPAEAEGVTRRVELEAPPAAVWDALTEETLLGEWLADEVEIEAEPGGEIVCRYADGEERRGEVELVEEAERLAWSWWRAGDAGPSRVELILDAVAAGTRLTVVETPAAFATAPSGASGPLLAAAPLTAAPLTAVTWGPPLGRLRAAVRLVLA
ncbi:MAG TPA: SRPBCC domain-containing protein [Solirubrobacterales bacterium]|nr:SRPBCC domain-containing protein [Solirubrobacterales bacterium]